MMHATGQPPMMPPAPQQMAPQQGPNGMPPQPVGMPMGPPGAALPPRPGLGPPGMGPPRPNGMPAGPQGPPTLMKAQGPPGGPPRPPGPSNGPLGHPGVPPSAGMPQNPRQNGVAPTAQPSAAGPPRPQMHPAMPPGPQMHPAPQRPQMGGPPRPGGPPMGQQQPPVSLGPPASMPGQMPPMPGQMPPMPGQQPPMPGQQPPMPGQQPPMPAQQPMHGQQHPMPGHQRPHQPGQQPGQQLPPIGQPPMPGQLPPMPGGPMPGGPMQGGPMPGGPRPNLNHNNQPMPGQMPPPPGAQRPPGPHGPPGAQPMMNNAGQPPMPPMMNNVGQPPMPGQPPGQPGYPPARPNGMPGPMNPQQPGQMPPAPGGYPAQAQPQPYPAGGGAYPGGNQVQSPRRALDPDQMPSPITVIEEDQRAHSGYFDTKEKGATPPLVTTKFCVRDYGNASPRFMRSTMYNVPATPDMMKQCGVPFSLVISPFAPVEEGEHDPPVSDFGPTGPVRCARCKAYMSPFMQFIDGGRRFQCPFCKATTEVPQEYFAHLDHNGNRLDHYQRPELCLGAYECVATKDYCRDSIEPNVPAVIFAIDVSYPMMKEGVVQMICRNMKSLLKHLPRDMHCDKQQMRVGFVTYDSKVHFYNLNKGLSQPQMMTVGDVGDMFVPLVEGFMVNAEESEAVIDALMEQIPAMFGETRETETVLGPVIQAGKEAFKAAQCAGKLIVFHHNLPVAEAPGKLKNRDDRKLLGTEKEKTVLMPQDKFYSDLGQECVSVGCSVDLFLFNNAYVDVATLSQVTRLTGGQLYKYTYFQPETDGERFIKDLEHDLSRPVVFDAIMRVRTSTGVRPVDFYGSFYMANTTDTELASINSDSAIACEIKHDDKLTEEDGVYIQVAVLFTSCSGQRRLRILNLALNSGVSMADMYRNCELDTVVNFVAKQSISRLMESNPKTVKEHLITNCANILACYRKNCASPSSAGQLILPECMKLLPLYTNCLLKSDALAGGADVGCDDRAFMMSTVSSMDVNSSSVYFYPRLFPIHDLNTSEEGLPEQIRCSIDKIQENGVYLLENGIYVFMYITLAADPNWIQDVFGVPSAAQVVVERAYLEERSNPMSDRVRGIVEALRSVRSRHMRLVLVRQKDKLDILFRHYLCEDRAGSTNADANFSYVDFLCHMHKEIRALLG